VIQERKGFSPVFKKQKDRQVKYGGLFIFGMSGSHQILLAMGTDRFNELELSGLSLNYEALHH
jgi:hypothetical protein